MSRVLVTGATGFVGRQLCELLSQQGYEVVGATRSNEQPAGNGRYALHAIGDIAGAVDWGPLLAGVDFVVHLAARVHVMRDTEKDPLAAFRRVNVQGTKQLLGHEGMRNVRRVVYLSTVKVHGDVTGDRPFSTSDVLAPTDPYARSKLEAEQRVQSLGAAAGFETTIIRPPLVYGPGVGGNFIRLIKMIDKGMPLPFGAVDNRRSLVGVANLCDLIRECLANPAAADQELLVSDNADLSTPALVRLIATALSRPARLVPVPTAALTMLATLLGRSAEISRLTGSLQVDVSKTLETLNWQPRVSPADGIAATVSWYREQASRA